MVSDCGLHDLGYSGLNYTWSHGNCYVRLDRCFGNTHWFERFPRSLLHHLLRMKSDHRPIFLSTDDHVNATRPYAFKYFAGWSLHGDFNRFVRDNWLSNQPVHEAIRHFSEAASKWNSEVFGSIGRNKKILMARLRGVQRCLDRRRSRNMVKLESKLLEELELLLDQEELLWKQKSRIDWINFGDRNTSYYHSKAKARTRKKAIQSLKLTDSEWCSDHEQLRAAATSYFATMFDVDNAALTSFPFVGSFPPIAKAITASLTLISPESEIRSCCVT
ncbi:hypothetical protein V6N13_074168 [Hibiscus sabdariffa]